MNEYKYFRIASTGDDEYSIYEIEVFAETEEPDDPDTGDVVIFEIIVAVTTMAIMIFVALKKRRA